MKITKRGVTLVELIATIAILAIVGLLTTPMFISAYRSFAISNAKAQAQSEVDLALREITKKAEAAEVFTNIDTGNPRILEFAVLVRNAGGTLFSDPSNPVPAPSEFDYYSNPANYDVYRYTWTDPTPDNPADDTGTAPIYLEIFYGTGGSSGQVPIARNIVDFQIRPVDNEGATVDPDQTNTVEVVVGSRVQVGDQWVKTDYKSAGVLRARRAGQ